MNNTKFFIMVLFFIIESTVYSQSSLNTTLIGQCSIQDGAYNVTVKDNYAYVATLKGMKVVNVIDPTKPEVIGSFDLPIFAGVQDCEINNQHLFLLEDHEGLHIIDVSNPLNPVKVAQWKDERYIFYNNIIL